MQVLHMNKGEGETSYAKNSLIQKKIILVGSSMLESAIANILWEVKPGSMGVADLGCSSGPNSLTVISKIVHMVQAASDRMGRPMPELRISLNDLPGNDFNYVFQSLPELYKKLKLDCGIEGNCYIWGLPGSFYGRLFPSHSLHFVHSSSSLHWLSQVPSGLEPCAGTHLNKEKVYISKSSSTSVVEAYQQQFHEDFSLFLRSRAKEMVAKGRMVLSFMGRRSPDPRADEACYQWELLARALMSMALDGLVEKESIDSFNAPYYAPSLEEVQYEAEKEGSFAVDCVEAFEIEWDGGDTSDLKESRGTRVSKIIRAVVEPMMESHFHLRHERMDELFMRYAKIVDGCLSKTRSIYINLLISFVKKD
ncbi:jasmonate O-methyltransferase-like [Cynara cardunculus var. scolymus]|uniref:jasmonate O-methyltransferase-like n=1 Tax=Cynara cardunculus var. scolymus TaxID=59895 RepID=UPI000D62E673|nr:jasmonate O-methyltransferase-like [Cynara cardunculus var. scolymus]